MSILVIFIIAVSLSMDAFSLSLAYGTLNIEKEKRIILSTIVGIYHFVMPIIGMYVGRTILFLLPVKPTTVVFIVLLVIGIQMIIETQKESRINVLNIGELLLFGLAVSIDSFSIGIGLNAIYDKPIIAAIIFSIISYIFTYLGLFLGTKINDKIGKYSTIIGGIVLIIIGILYLF